MSKTIHTAVALIALFLIAIGLTACGDGGGMADGVVAQLGKISISRTELSHWMSTLAAGDFNELSKGRTVPAGLVSDPPNYSTCVASLRTAAASASSDESKSLATVPKETPVQLLNKCRQLHQALRKQAIEYLVNARWVIGVDAEAGVTASGREVRQVLGELKTEVFPSKGQFQQYLASTRRSISDEMLVLKLNLLSQKLQQKVDVEGKRLLTKLTEIGQRWTTKTNCRRGYVVKHCRQYTGESTPSTPSTPSPAVLMEQVAAITGSPCINREACG